ncbi:C2 family cysteine protease [Chamaesiphon minutus]|uniref:Putative pre-peptidase n=1 Tax=Chamaesiphon minutus (strain ATCC 27169 / PCC 6605) TaxID=1173020 RepID=K9UIG2_CHAP6|nr:C2 family cysteine protease [Chamaesiphon minutus]AFY94438.1 putative pre-peptidase [Chamaesiphon minutus PCC 6605]
MFDTQNTAQNVLLGSGVQSFGGSVANLDGLDYYKLQVNNRSNVSMSLSGLGGDVNLFLLDSASRQLAASSATGIRSELIKTTLDAGTYFVKVQQATSTTSSPYQITFSNDPLFSTANSTPQSLIINGVRTSYAANSTLTLSTSYVSDSDGWQDVSKVDFWLTDRSNNRIELADVDTFTSHNAASAKFGYSTSLSQLGLAVGAYQLNAVAYDRAGVASNKFTSSAFNVINSAAQNLSISGIQSNYDSTSTLTIAPSFVSDSNGWQDVAKVDFWLTDSGNRRVELADVTSFTGNGLTSARFGYSTSLLGLASGAYKLNAVAIDKANAKSSTFTSSTFNIANSKSQDLEINGVLASYNVDDKLTLGTSYVSDNNGWRDVSKVDFWLTDRSNNRIELADVTSFSSNNLTSAKFGYSTTLTGLVVGNYNLNAVAYDKAGVASSQVMRSFSLTNAAPKTLTLNGINASYDANSTITLAPSFVSDSNGWQDVNNVDFWLTDSKGKRIELADVTSFTSNSLTTAKFDYAANLSQLGLTTGNYNLNAIAYDKSGGVSSRSVKSFAVNNTAPTTLTVNGVKSSYDLNSTLTIDPSFVTDNNGWQDVGKVDFWLTDSLNRRIELADVTSFTSDTAIAAKFGYSTSLAGLAAGNYSLNAVAYDRVGVASNTYAKSLNLVNSAPQTVTLNGLKSVYSKSSILELASSYVSDINGWQDVNKVDFWLTDSKNNRIELADVTSFTANGTNLAKFDYSTSLSALGLAAGDYNLNAVAYDKTGAASTRVSQLFNLSATLDWFDLNLKDVGVVGLARSKAADGQLDRNDLLSIFRDVQDGSVVDTSELTDLKSLMATTTPFSISDPVRYLSNKLVTDAYANINTTNFEASLGKWFLGTVAPTPTFTSSGKTTNFIYTRFQGPLFGTNTSARIGGIDQRSFGNCVLLAALGATFAPQSNDAGNSISKTINDMLLDNGDNTYTVRFFTQDLKAEWVTVDNRLATTDGKNLFGTSNKDGLWAPIIEKACAQWREFNEGSSTRTGWDIIGNGDYLDDGLQRVTGRAARNYYTGGGSWDFSFNLIKDSLSAGKAILSAGVPSVNGLNLISGHAYTVTNAYISNTGEQRVVVRNPWGIDYAWSGAADGNNDGFLDLSYDQFRTFGYITIA